MVRTFRERQLGGKASAAQNGSSLFGFLLFLQKTGSAGTKYIARKSALTISSDGSKAVTRVVPFRLQIPVLRTGFFITQKQDFIVGIVFLSFKEEKL